MGDTKFWLLDCNEKKKIDTDLSMKGNAVYSLELYSEIKYDLNILSVQSQKGIKGKDQFWSGDCIVKETFWNRSEKVDHLAYKYWCVLQGSGIIKMIRNLAQSS